MGGWQNLLREDGTGLKNEGDCVSYAAHGRMLKSCAGSENFSEFAEFLNSRPCSRPAPSTRPTVPPAGPSCREASAVVTSPRWHSPAVHRTRLELAPAQLHQHRRLPEVGSPGQSQRRATTLTSTPATHLTLSSSSAHRDRSQQQRSGVVCPLVQQQHQALHGLDQRPPPLPFGVETTTIVWPAPNKTIRRAGGSDHEPPAPLASMAGNWAWGSW